jgi:hypothetical protein
MVSRTFTLALIGACCLSAPATATAAGGKCESVEARCAVAAGGLCNSDTGHWCYGFYEGRNCGGTSAAFRTCMASNGAGNGAANHTRATAVAATGGDKCVSDQARCAKEVGGFCNPRTGAWCVGGVGRFGRWCGGTIAAHIACLDRVRAARR